MSAEGISTFADRFPVKGDDGDALKLRFAALEYALALDANLAQSGRLVAAARGVQDQDWNAIAARPAAESDLRVDSSVFAGLENGVEALARTKRPLWNALATFALVLALVEFYLYSRRRVE